MFDCVLKYEVYFGLTLILTVAAAPEEFSWNILLPPMSTPRWNLDTAIWTLDSRCANKALWITERPGDGVIMLVGLWGSVSEIRAANNKIKLGISLHRRCLHSYQLLWNGSVLLRCEIYHVSCQVIDIAYFFLITQHSRPLCVSPSATCVRPKYMLIYLTGVLNQSWNFKSVLTPVESVVFCFRNPCFLTRVEALLFNNTQCSSRWTSKERSKESAPCIWFTWKCVTHPKAIYLRKWGIEAQVFLWQFIDTWKDSKVIWARLFPHCDVSQIVLHKTISGLAGNSHLTRDKFFSNMWRSCWSKF